MKLGDFLYSWMERSPFPSRKAAMYFFSYNHGDKIEAEKLRKELEQNGIKVWMDNTYMNPGESIKDFIERSIQSTDVTISLVSNKSLLSAWVAMETIYTFHHQAFDPDKQFIACYLDDDFFKPRFRLDATKIIDAKLAEIDELIPSYIEQKIDTNDLNSEKSRLYDLRNNLGKILDHLKGSLALDIRESMFDQSVKKIVHMLT